MKKTINVLICFVIIIYCLYADAFAVEHDNNIDIEITLIELTESEKSDYFERFSVDVLDNNSKVYNDSYIYSFDVSEEGKCAVFLDSAAILVFDNNGTVERILKFKNDILNVRVPSEVMLQWDNSNLKLILGYNIVCLFNTEGDLIEVYKYETELRSLPKQTTITRNQQTFEIIYSNPFIHFLGGEKYDQLIMKDNSGKDIVLFECEKSMPNITVFVLGFLLVFIIVVAFVVVKVVLRTHKKTGQLSNKGNNKTRDGSVIDK